MVRDNYPANIEAPQRVYFQYSHDIDFNYSTGKYPTGEESSFDWENYFIPVEHNYNGRIVGGHVFMRIKIGTDGQWTTPIRMNNLYIIDNILLEKTNYNSITLTNTYRFKFILGDENIIYTDTFEIKDASVSQEQMGTALIKYLTANLAANRIVETTTSGSNIVLTGVTKNTAYNKNFGIAPNTVAQGNHTHPTLYASLFTTITAGTGLTGGGNLVTDVSLAIDPAYASFTNYSTKVQADNLYAALAHNHTIADITNLQTTLNGKSNAANNLSDLADNAIARNNLSVYSKTESNALYLQISNNLSDVTAATARVNLGLVPTVYSITSFDIAGTTGTIYYSKDYNNIVRVWGDISLSFLPGNFTKLCKLPSGFRPVNDKVYFISYIAVSTGEETTAYIENTGDIYIIGKSNTINISYQA